METYPLSDMQALLHTHLCDYQMARSIDGQMLCIRESCIDPNQLHTVSNYVVDKHNRMYTANADDGCITSTPHDADSSDLLEGSIAYGFNAVYMDSAINDDHNDTNSCSFSSTSVGTPISGIFPTNIQGNLLSGEYLYYDAHSTSPTPPSIETDDAYLPSSSASDYSLEDQLNMITTWSLNKVPSAGPFSRKKVSEHRCGKKTRGTSSGTESLDDTARPYKCNHIGRQGVKCEASFGTNEHRTRHYKTHEKETMIRCTLMVNKRGQVYEQCGMLLASRNDNFDDHMARHVQAYAKSFRKESRCRLGKLSLEHMQEQIMRRCHGDEDKAYVQLKKIESRLKAYAPRFRRFQLTLQKDISMDVKVEYK